MSTSDPKSAVGGVIFPALAGAQASQALALQFQLERTQWLPPEVLAAKQRAQLRHVLEHAMRTVPYYRRLLSGLSLPDELDEGFLRTLPVSRRMMIADAGSELHSESLPADHGKARGVTTSGTTGTPVKLAATGVTDFLWRGFTLRDHLWHQRDFSAKLGAIRWAEKDFAKAPDGARWTGWGGAVDPVYESGPSCMLNVATPLAGQVEWLQRERPRYLVSFPSNLAALAEYCLERGLELASLAEVRTIGEMLTDGQRALYERAWRCKVIDIYTCEEAGYLALQCPSGTRYHVQSENVILELVEGQVLVTTLHNFATPLIRYELGDFAEAGARCGCGRGLPVISRLRGRSRNRLRLPDGRSEFPYLGEHGQIARATGVQVRQFQFIQRSVEEVEVKLVTDRAFTDGEAQAVQRLVQGNLGYPFRITVTRCEEIPKGPRGKYEEFVSEIGS